MKYYNIIEKTKYGMKIVSLDNIEDVDEEFLDEKELNEMGIEDTSTSYSFNAKAYMTGERWHRFDHKIKAAIQEWVGLIPKGKKSILCTDDDLIEILSDEARTRSVHMCMFDADHIARSGARFSIKPKKPVRLKTNTSDWYKLGDLARKAFGYHEIYIYPKMLSRGVNDKETMLKSIKKVVPWKSMKKANDELKVNDYDGKPVDDAQLVLIKKIWDNPATANDL